MHESPVTVHATDSRRDSAVAATDDAHRDWLRLLPVAGLLAVLALTTAIRWRYLDTPLERDEGEFAYGAQRILAGELPYVSFYAMKLPGIYVSYAAVLTIFGERARGIHLGLLCVNLASIALVFLLGRKFFDGWGGVVAAAAFALLTLSPAVQGTQTQSEHFVLLPALLGAGLLLSAGSRAWMFLAAGLCFGLALVIKQQGATFGLAALAWCLLARNGKGFLLCALGYVLPLALACLFFAFEGAWEPFTFWTWIYPRAYIARYTFTAASQRLTEEMQLQLHWLWPLWIAGVAGGAGLLARGRREALYFVVPWLAASLLAIAPGGLFRGHYFIFLAPALALLVAAAPRMRGWLPATAVGASAILLMAYLLPKSPEQLSSIMYPSFFVESPRIAAFVASQTSPDEPVAILGSEPQILFLADRRSLSGHIYMYPLVENQPLAEKLQKEFMAELEKKKPATVIYVADELSWLPHVDGPQEILSWAPRWLAENYHALCRIERMGNSTSARFIEGDQVREPPQSDTYLLVMRRNAGR